MTRPSEESGPARLLSPNERPQARGPMATCPSKPRRPSQHAPAWASLGGVLAQAVGASIWTASLSQRMQRQQWLGDSDPPHTRGYGLHVQTTCRGRRERHDSGRQVVESLLFRVDGDGPRPRFIASRATRRRSSPGSTPDFLARRCPRSRHRLRRGKRPTPYGVGLARSRESRPAVRPRGALLSIPVRIPDGPHALRHPGPRPLLPHLHRPQPQRVGHHRHGAQAHGGGGDHRVE